MKTPSQITSRDIELTDAIKAEIDKRVAKLEDVCDSIVRCRVVLESPHRHSHDGKLFSLRIELGVPGSEIVIKREPNEDLYVAIRDSFDAARRKLEEFERVRRGDVKHHEETPVGRIASIFHEKGYGFISTPEGREIYFHRNSIRRKPFDKLSAGMDVRFHEEQGEEGPRATSVVVLGA